MTRRDWLLSIAALAIVTLLLFWQPIGVWLGLLERKEVEIDRGPTAGTLGERFMSGGEFIRFVYESGSRCERTQPCPAAAESSPQPK